MATHVEIAPATATATLTPRVRAVEAARQFASKKPLGAAGATTIVGMLLVAASAELLAPYEAYTADYAAQFPAPSAEHCSAPTA